MKHLSTHKAFIRCFLVLLSASYIAQVEEDPPRTDQEVESIHAAAAAAAAVDTAALEKRMQGWSFGFRFC